MKIERGTKVRVAVELRKLDGTVIESSGVEYVQGGGTMLRGLEKALEGLEAGDSKEGVIPAADAFGTEEQLPTKAMPRAEFPKEAQLDVGAVFQAKDAGGRPVSFKIVAVTKETVTVRFLHPLMNQDIRFKVKVLAVTDPSVVQRVPPPPAEALKLEDDDISEEK